MTRYPWVMCAARCFVAAITHTSPKPPLLQLRCQFTSLRRGQWRGEGRGEGRAARNDGPGGPRMAPLRAFVSHGRGFFPGALPLSDWVAGLGPAEAVLGLCIELIH